ncbi:MAG: thioether cross-link-forming SCIFF peptide maturase, partial [Oscillospiraceae bacterium]|nr:thioether cross-link-forming SCIFF peptide maturase [Oscillospiraceae bacterium]
MIHQYKLGGYNIVLDVCSGSVHTVDDLAYDMIALYEQHTKEKVLRQITEKYGSQPEITAEDIAGCYDDITALKEQGKLFSPDTFEP